VGLKDCGRGFSCDGRDFALDGLDVEIERIKDPSGEYVIGYKGVDLAVYRNGEFYCTVDGLKSPKLEANCTLFQLVARMNDVLG
jgi:hypothetical protein